MDDHWEYKYSESMEEEDEELELGMPQKYEEKGNGAYLTALDFINDPVPANQEARPHQMATVQVVKNPPRNQSNDSLYSLSSAKNKSSVKNQYINRIQELTKDEKLREHLEKSEDNNLLLQTDLPGISTPRPPSINNGDGYQANSNSNENGQKRMHTVSSSRDLLMKRVGSTELSLAEMQDEKTFKSRESARASRQRKKLYTELLEKKVEQLENDNATLSKKLQDSTSRDQQYHAVVSLSLGPPNVSLGLNPFKKQTLTIQSQVEQLVSDLDNNDQESLEINLDLLFCRLTERRILREQIIKKLHGQIIESLLPEHTKCILNIIKGLRTPEKSEEIVGMLTLNQQQAKTLKDLYPEISETLGGLKTHLIAFNKMRDDLISQSKDLIRKVDQMKTVLSEKQLALVFKTIYIQHKFAVNISEIFK